MGLFYRRELQQTEALYLVTDSQGDARLIVGLGNPGKQYDKTRHNVGFACVDEFVDSQKGTWVHKKQFKASVCELRLGQSRVVVIKPDTFMNLSGEAVQAVQHLYKIANNKTIVVHDELDIPFGQIRTKTGGGAAGHNGIKSLTTHIGADFGRVRVGIANDQAKLVDSADFVLQRFNKEELANMKALTNEVQVILNEAIFGGALHTETRSFLS